MPQVTLQACASVVSLDVSNIKYMMLCMKNKGKTLRLKEI